MDMIMMNSNGVAPNSIQNLTKINDLLLKNHSSIKRLNELEERLDLSKISEVSRRSRHINFHCQNELVYTLNQANLNEYSYTIRLLFQIFGLSEDLFVDNYVGYMQFYFMEIRNIKEKEETKALASKDQSAMSRNNPNQMMQGRGGQDERRVVRGMVPSYDFEDDESAQKSMAEKMKEREEQVQERVKKLINMWNKTKVTDEFEKETDPMVILAIQKRLHSELNEDFKTNLEGMSRYLTKKDVAMYKKQDYGALTAHLTKMQSVMQNAANKDTVFGLSNKWDDEANKETLNEIQNCLLECFDEKQRKLIIILIKKMLGLHQQSMCNKETMTGVQIASHIKNDGTTPSGANKRYDPKANKGKDTVESLRAELQNLDLDYR